MKIRVCEEEGGKKFSIRIPNSLVFNRVVGWIAQKGSKDFPLRPEQLAHFGRVLNECHRRHPGLELVSVESGTGERVQVWL